VDEARASLRQLLRKVVLQPTAASLVAELRGNIEGLLSLTGGQALVVGTTGSGGPILIVLQCLRPAAGWAERDRPGPDFDRIGGISPSSRQPSVKFSGLALKVGFESRRNRLLRT
jgi:hypothetical protein